MREWLGMENGTKDAIADKLADIIHFSEWYFMNTMNYCEGNFSPSATALNPSANLTDCSTLRPQCKWCLEPHLTHLTHLTTALDTFDITEIIKRQLNGAQETVDFASAMGLAPLQRKIDACRGGFPYLFGLKAAFLFAIGGLFALLIISGRDTSFSFIDIYAKAAVVVSCMYLVLASFATGFARSCANGINSAGKTVGVSAKPGAKHIGVSWAMFAMCLVSSLLWCVVVMRSDVAYISLPQVEDVKEIQRMGLAWLRQRRKGSNATILDSETRPYASDYGKELD